MKEILNKIKENIDKLIYDYKNTIFTSINNYVYDGFDDYNNNLKIILQNNIIACFNKCVQIIKNNNEYNACYFNNIFEKDILLNITVNETKLKNDVNWMSMLKNTLSILEFILNFQNIINKHSLPLIYQKKIQ